MKTRLVLDVCNHVFCGIDMHAFVFIISAECVSSDCLGKVDDVLKTQKDYILQAYVEVHILSPSNLIYSEKANKAWRKLLSLSYLELCVS